MSSIPVVILAGGLGSRMGGVCQNIPKPMVRIGDRPLLEHQILLCRRYGLQDITIITGFQAEYIEDYFRAGSAWGVSIRYYREQTPLGTTGGIKEIEADLLQDFIIMYGDVMVDMDLLRLVDFHRDRCSDCTLVVHPNDHPFDSDLVEIDANARITAIHAKPHPPDRVYRNLVNAALYVMSPRMLSFIEKGVKSDFGRDIFPAIVNRINMFGYVTAEYIKDAGTPDRLDAVVKDWQSGCITRFHRANRRPAVFMDRDGVINREVGLLHDAANFELLPGTADAVRSLNASDFLAIVITNQSVVARNLCSIEQLEYINKQMETLLGQQHARLDAIYYCPHHPDRGYPEENVLYKIDCTCRKPKPGMVLQAAEDFNIDLSSSFFIGDSEADIECGKNAGLTTIGVRTGHGCRVSAHAPDYFFDNLDEAVFFLVNNPYGEVFRAVSACPSRVAKKKPFVIAVGGNSRAGKSVCARYLAGEFRKQGAGVLHVQLDNWLVPQDRRQQCTGVHARFQLPLLQADLEGLLNGNTITRSQYDPLIRSFTGDIVRYNAGHSDVIILDGVVALSAASVRARSDFKLFCDINEGLLRDRITRYYEWKGLGIAEIDKIFSARQEDEYTIIQQDRRFADLVVDHAGNILS